jgi:hypothetical protein
MKFQWLTYLLIFALVLAGCNLPTPPVDVGTPTVTLTAENGLTPEPEITDTAAPDATATTAPDATATTAAPPTAPAATATTPPGLPERPEEAIMILEPGPGSRVSSPIRIMGWADSTFEQNLVIRVLTADGTQVALAPTTIQSELGQRGPFEIVLPVALTSEQNIFIQVYASSARDGGITHLSAVGVTFAPGGGTNIITREPHPEQITIFSPQIRDTFRGGVARVEGFGLASFEQTLVAEVQDENGQVIGMTPITVQAPDLGQPGPFSADIPYTLAQSGPGRIVVRDISPAFGGDVHLSSVEVLLEP